MRECFCVVLILSSRLVLGANVDSPAAPDDVASARYTLTDIYNRLDTGAPGAKRVGAFVEPSSGPSVSSKTTDEIMAKAPALDDVNGADAAHVLSGKKFWGILSTAWGPKTGTLLNNGAVTITPGTADQIIATGYHDGTGKVIGDGNLVSGNIRGGVTVFGVAGDSNVVNTGSGDVMADDVVTGRKAWVDGVEVTGSRPPQPVFRTGQTATAPLNPAPAGSDGALQKGLAVPSSRFTDNGDGTITDNKTKLIWLKDANPCGPPQTWADALNYCNSLASGTAGLTDGSVAGDWRLPNIAELESLIAWQYCTPALSNTVGDAKWSAGNPFTNVQSNNYWSSTTCANNTINAWLLNLDTGRVGDWGKASTSLVWAVRGGQ